MTRPRWCSWAGTVAAAREAVLHGWRAIALSHYHKKGRAIDWQRAAAWVRPILRRLKEQPQEAGVFWNVNLPHLEPGATDPEVVFCRLDPAPLPLSFRREGDSLHHDGDYHRRRRGSGTDIDVCFGGRIAVTRLTLS
jgi:5'-nucleotidase